MSLNFVILRHLGVISRQKGQLQKSYNLDSIGPPCSKTHMCYAKKGSCFYDKLLSFLDQAVEQEFLTSSARQIIISAATAEQLIDQLQSFIPVIDPCMSRLNWSTKESSKKLKLDLSLYL